MPVSLLYSLSRLWLIRLNCVMCVMVPQPQSWTCHHRRTLKPFCCRSRGGLQPRCSAVLLLRGMMDPFAHEEDVPFEVAETEIIDWNPGREWPMAREWKGPLSKMNCDKASRRDTMWVHLTGSGVCGKKYNFQEEFLWQGNVVWVYKHCRSPTQLIIRQVKPSPRIDVLMTIEAGGVGTRVTAVAGTEEIYHTVITEDTRAKSFKDTVKRACIYIHGTCTKQTDLTIYYNNAPMSSNLVMRNDMRRGRPRLHETSMIEASSIHLMLPLDLGASANFQLPWYSTPNPTTSADNSRAVSPEPGPSL